MREWLRDIFSGRPVWMNVLMVFSAYMAFVYLPWDIFWKPVEQDREVWFGYMFSGWAAKLTALAHWFVYAAATYGFRRMRPWMPVASALYTAQIAFGMVVWAVLVWGGFLGWLAGLVAAVPFAVLTLALWSSDAFGRERVPMRERYGEWALVTGASAGIGAEFARALARQGLSCVLTARREDRLKELAQELESAHGVATRVVAADLSQPEGARQLLDALGELEIDVLVNNAGLGYAGRFDGQDTARLADMVRVNCLAPVELTSRLLPAMRERGSGAVIFTGSVAGRQPLPLHALYSATKAFDNYLGEALWMELRGTGVDVLVLEPGATETEFQQVAGEIAHPGEPPARVVEAALEALGSQPSVVSGWFNWLRANLATRLGSRPLVLHVAHQVMAEQTPPELRSIPTSADSTDSAGPYG